jgi:hypothetical protein
VFPASRFLLCYPLALLFSLFSTKIHYGVSLFDFRLICASHHNLDLTTVIENKRFWEELIAYFPSYYTDCTENEESNSSSVVANVLVPATTF